MVKKWARKTYTTVDSSVIQELCDTVNMKSPLFKFTYMNNMFKYNQSTGKEDLSEEDDSEDKTPPSETDFGLTPTKDIGTQTPSICDSPIRSMRSKTPG